ncbi:hypothetical protein RCH17_000163 [Arthrobacter sp. MP_M7]|nr:hypothetical protein [Arthrobacter sp. MP_M4]MEC5201384.1 hypothetical protein [Arthrobacter sp. MP_M7]
MGTSLRPLWQTKTALALVAGPLMGYLGVTSR